MGFGMIVNREFERLNFNTGVTMSGISDLSTLPDNPNQNYTDALSYYSSQEGESSVASLRRYFGRDGKWFSRVVFHLATSARVNKQLDIGWRLEYRYGYTRLDTFEYYYGFKEASSPDPLRINESSKKATLTINQSRWSTGIYLRYRLDIIRFNKRR